MISAITMKNFKCFQDQTIRISPLTLLSGINSSGKSTVIQSLLLLRQSYNERLLDKGLSLNGEYVDVGTGKDVLFERANEPEEITIGIEVDGLMQHLWVFDYTSHVNFLPLEAAIEIPKVSLFTDQFEYLSAERIGPRSTYLKSTFMVAEHEHLGKMGEYTQHYLHLYGRKPILNTRVCLDEWQERDLLSLVQKWLNSISPGVRIETSEYAYTDLVGMQYKYADKEVSNPYRPANVGFGVSFILPVVVALLKAREGDLLIIENPEAHLHPKGQRMMGELMSRAVSGGVQVLTETHSDHILNGVRLSVRKGILEPTQVALHYLSKSDVGEHQLQTPIIKNDGRLDYWPDGFFDEWDKALDEFF